MDDHDHKKINKFYIGSYKIQQIRSSSKLQSISLLLLALLQLSPLLLLVLALLTKLLPQLMQIFKLNHICTLA